MSDGTGAGSTRKTKTTASKKTTRKKTAAKATSNKTTTKKTTAKKTTTKKAATKATKKATSKKVAKKATPKAKTVSHAVEVATSAPTPEAITTRPLAVESMDLPARPQTAMRTVSVEERRRMIEEAAYYRAEKRGFRVDSTSNWLEAEAEIDAMLTGAARGSDE